MLSVERKSSVYLLLAAVHSDRQAVIFEPANLTVAREWNCLQLAGKRALETAFARSRRFRKGIAVRGPLIAQVPTCCPLTRAISQSLP